MEDVGRSSEGASPKYPPQPLLFSLQLSWACHLWPPHCAWHSGSDLGPELQIHKFNGFMGISPWKLQTEPIVLHTYQYCSSSCTLGIHKWCQSTLNCLVLRVTMLRYLLSLPSHIQSITKHVATYLCKVRSLLPATSLSLLLHLFLTPFPGPHYSSPRLWPSPLPSCHHLYLPFHPWHLPHSTSQNIDVTLLFKIHQWHLDYSCVTMLFILLLRWTVGF